MYSYNFDTLVVHDTTTTAPPTTIATTDSDLQESESSSEDWMICKAYVAEVVLSQCRQKMQRVEFVKAITRFHRVSCPSFGHRHWGPH